MIKNTFLFVPRISEKTEENFWKKGILSWQDLKRNSTTLSKIKRELLFNYVTEAENALSNRNASFFINNLPQKEYWRLYDEFRDQTLFLDIETTGTSLYYDKITLIGTFDGREYRVFVRDNNFLDFADYLRNYELVITFNGKLFDIPFIKKEFPGIRIPPIHIDLRYLLRSLGITGSLKQIEEKLGIKRPRELQKMRGRDAAVLWNKFIRGDDEALEKLIVYNFHDTVNLQPIMHFCYNTKVRRLVSKMNHRFYQLTLFENEKGRIFQFKTMISRSSIENDPLNLNMPKITLRVTNGLLNVYLNNEALITVDRNRIKKINIKIEDIIQEINHNRDPVAVGIDLSGSERRNSGICILKGKKAFLDVAKTDEEIVFKTIDANPSIVSIDSPLSLPRGRCCPEDTCDCRKYGITRECERILKRRGINVYPCLIKSMQKLTMRGIKLSKLFEEKGYEVIESYPGAAQDILGLPRKKINLEELEAELRDMGIKIQAKRKTITHDEIDALTSALVGYFYLAGKYEAIGNADEGYLIIPELKMD